MTLGPHHKNIFSRAVYGRELPLQVHRQPSSTSLCGPVWLALVADAINMTELPLWHESTHAAQSLNRIMARGTGFMTELAQKRYAHLDVDPMLLGAHEAIVAGYSASLGGPYCGTDREAFLLDKAVQAELSAMQPLAAAVATDFDLLEYQACPSSALPTMLKS